jgi:4-aminobutyrate aminotransferase/(S)-3-amino-2-methylpropionate transaminase
MTNEDLAQRRAHAIPRGVGSSTAIYAAHAENAELWDVEGRRYVDFAGGIAVLNVGHRHPRVLAAVRDQLDAYTHTAFQVVPYEPYVALAERLNALAPFSGKAKTILFTTGAEATENAVKIARAATGRPGLIAFAGGFHGRTLLASAMTGKVAPYKKGLGPFPPEVHHLPFPSETTGVTVADTLKALDFLFAADLEPERVAAIIIEPVQGEGGFHVAPPELFAALAELRERHGILLVADEVQSGFARTGRMFAIEHSGVEPDLVCVAKSLAGGFPLAGVIGRADVMDAVEPGGLGGTYGGSPVACAAALAVLDVIAEERLCARADAIGAHIRAAIERMAARNSTVPIGGLRGPGAMIAFDILDANGGPDGAEAKRVCARALEAGLILLSCGQHGQAIRILVPLTASDAILDEGLAMLERALTPAPVEVPEVARAEDVAA